MNKKMLIFILLIPFLIGILAFTTSNYIIRQVEQDIDDIILPYDENSSFLLKDGEKKLNATSLFDKEYPLAKDNELIFESSDESIARIILNDDGYYLLPVSEGSCIISCYNKKKTVVKKFNAVIIGDSGALILNPTLPFGNKALSKSYVVGTYDSIDSYNKGVYDSSLSLDIKLTLSSITKSELKVKHSSNISFDINTSTITYKKPGKAYLELTNPYSSVNNKARIDFTIKEAINIYSYNDLLNVTNKATKSYDSVLRVNLDSVINTYNDDFTYKSNNTRLFGRLDSENHLKSFKDDIYSYTTTYNHDFLDSWNDKVLNNELNKESVSIKSLAGIHIKGDIYGNGFTINTHNLTYPYAIKDVVAPDGSKSKIASLTDKNLFRGPLKFVSLGDPYYSIDSAKPIFALNGEDNSSFYIDSDNITIENINLKGANTDSNLTNYSYCGNVLNINSDNVTINNSIIENGRNVIRAYSSDNLKINNSIIRNGMEFLFKSGSNKYNKVDYNKEISYKANGNIIKTTTRDYMTPGINGGKNYKADSLLTYSTILNTQANDFIGVPDLTYEVSDYLSGRDVIKEALTNTKGIYTNGKKNYDGYATLNKVFFSNSGISAISLDSLPQGSFIENNTTSLFALIIGMYMDYLPTKLALTGYPTYVKLENDCRFYDWKSKDLLTFESLIEQDIKSLIEAHGGLGSGFKITITEDDFLPLKKILLDSFGNLILNNDKLNIAIYKQGGGFNDSDIFMDDEMKGYFTNALELDPFKYSLTLKQEPVDDFNTSPKAKYEAMKITMLRAASNVMGFNNHYIYALNNKYNKWYNESLMVEDLFI